MGKIKNKLSYFLIFVIITTSLLISGCVFNNKNKVNLVLDWTPNTNHTGFIVALEKGYYSEFGIDLNIIETSEEDNIALVASEKAQFGITSQENLGTALSNNNFEVISVATIVQNNTSGILSLKEKNINKFKDLEGKTYATWGLPFEQAILKQVIEKEEGNFENVDLYYSTVTDPISALDKNVDAVWVYEGWDVIAAKLLGVNYNFLKFKDVDLNLNFYSPILISNNKFLVENSDLVKNFLSATKKGYEFAAKNPEEAAKILVNHFPELDLTLVLESQKYLSNEYLDENGEWGFINPKVWNNFFKWAYNKKIIDKNLENTGFTNEFLEKSTLLNSSEEN